MYERWGCEGRAGGAQAASRWRAVVEDKKVRREAGSTVTRGYVVLDAKTGHNSHALSAAPLAGCCR